MAKTNLKSRACFGNGPYLAEIAQDGGHSILTDDYYWKHIRKPLLKRLRKGAVACAPDVDTFAEDPQGAIQQAYESLILDVIHTLGDELGALVIMVRDPDDE